MNAAKQNRALGVLFALMTVLVWGTTFISSKKLLDAYTPLQIMLTRFLLAYAALWLIRPRRMKLRAKEEGIFFLLGLAGCSIYFYVENTALRYTLTSNVSIIVASAPLFTALLAHFVTEEKFRSSTLWGFLVAFSGVILVVCNGTFVLRLSPIGDLLALAAAACWAVYSVLIKRFAGTYDSVLITRRTVFWGIVTAVPMVLLEGKPYPLAPLTESPAAPLNFLYLGLIGSAVCYVLWNEAFARLGIVRTNNFIYAIPFVTIVAAHFLLHESISSAAFFGAVLITAGVIWAQRPPKARTTKEPESVSNI